MKQLYGRSLDEMQCTLEKVYLYKFLFDCGVLESFRDEFMEYVEDGYENFVMEEALFLLSEAVWSNYSEYVGVESLYFSHPDIMEYYRLCRVYGKKYGIKRAIAGHLAKRHDLRGVPGFYYSKHGHWELWGKPGMLIPICDADGYIQGIQIRLDNADKKKYRWLSSNPDYGFPYGTPSSVWVHVTGNRNAKVAYITEGGLKGDVASYLSGDRLFICTAGVSSIQYLYDTLKSLDVFKINGCYDMDQVKTLNRLLEQRKNPFDSEAYKPCPLEKMESVIRKTGIMYERRVWPREYNGIDEYYLDWLMRENRKAA